MKIPAQITAGDSISWDDDPSADNLGNSVDSGTWTLKYDFRQSGVTNLTVTASAHGTGWRTTLSKAQTAAYAAGKVYFQAYAEAGSNRVTLGAGVIMIRPNVSAALNTAEFRTQAQQDLEAVQAAMRAMISGGAVAEYSIAGRSLRKIPMADLIILERKLKSEVAAEKKADSIANGLGNPSSVFIRFNR